MPDFEPQGLLPKPVFLTTLCPASPQLIRMLPSSGQSSASVGGSLAEGPEDSLALAHAWGDLGESGPKT